MAVPTGYSQDRMGDFFGLIVIRSPLPQIVAAAENMPQGQQRTSHASELEGGAWTLLTWDKCRSGLAGVLSAHLQTTVAYLWDEDTSGWFGYSVFKNGAELETFQFGMNYEDELADFAEELGEEMPTEESKKEGWDVFVSQGGYDFQFRSSLVEVGEDEVVNGYEHVNARFHALDIPDPVAFPKTHAEISMPDSGDA